MAMDERPREEDQQQHILWPWLHEGSRRPRGERSKVVNGGPGDMEKLVETSVADISDYVWDTVKMQ